MELVIIVGGKVKRVVSLFLSAYLNFYMVVAENNKLNANEGTALAQIFCTKCNPTVTQSSKVAESNESDASEGMIFAQTFAQT